jgi:hypothetical protein
MKNPENAKRAARQQPGSASKPTQIISPQLDAGRTNSSAPRPVSVAAEDNDWLATALSAVADLAAAGQPFTAYDLVTQRGVPEPRDGAHMWGALMAIARAHGIVVAVAAVPSSRPRTARSLCRLWVGAGHASDAAVAS